MLSTLVLAATSFSMAPVARVTRSSVRMNVDLTEQFGYDVETGGQPWDPLGYADKPDYDFDYVRAVELKHGRVAMLGAVGLLFPELFGTWDNADGLFDASNPILAFATVPPLGIAQIVGVVGLIEWRTGKGIEGARIPGDIGFDPLGLSEEGISEKYALAELKNGRLAMIASIGMIVQSLISGEGVIKNSLAVIGA